MTEEPIKKRMRRAVQAAVKLLSYPEGNHDYVYKLGSGPFHIQAIRKLEIRYIRIVLDEIKKDDEKLVLKIKIPPNCTREIWCRALNGAFWIRKIY